MVPLRVLGRRVRLEVGHDRVEPLRRLGDVRAGNSVTELLHREGFFNVGLLQDADGRISVGLSYVVARVAGCWDAVATHGIGIRLLEIGERDAKGHGPVRDPSNFGGIDEPSADARADDDAVETSISVLKHPYDGSRRTTESIYDRGSGIDRRE